jgi:hypothetical protein
MIVQNNLSFNVNTHLLLSIFWQTTWHSDYPITSAKEYCAANTFNIEASCKVFGWLGLAIRDEGSPIEWRPTYVLNSLLATRRRRMSRSKKRPPTKSDTRVLSGLLDSAPQAATDYIRSVLGFVGLLSMTDGGILVPTRRLRKLVVGRRPEQRERRLVWSVDIKSGVAGGAAFFARVQSSGCRAPPRPSDRVTWRERSTQC